MVRRYILTAALYNADALSILDFIVQCSEMYKDDVFNGTPEDGSKVVMRFHRYKMAMGGFNHHLFRRVRNIYIHAFDTSLDALYTDLLVLRVSDIEQACIYFGVPFDRMDVFNKLRRTRQLIKYMLNLEELNGSKES